MSAIFRLTASIPHESEIQKVALHYLQRHPFVAWAERFNSGAFGGEYEDKQGRSKRHFVRFSTLEGCPDIIGQLTNGLHLAVEMKRPPWHKPAPPNPSKKGGMREYNQHQHLLNVVRHGGVGFFATSVEEVAARINAAARGIIAPPLWLDAQAAILSATKGG